MNRRSRRADNRGMQRGTRFGMAAAALGIVLVAAAGGAAMVSGAPSKVPKPTLDLVRDAQVASRRLDGVSSAQTSYGMLAGVVTELVALDAFGSRVPKELNRYSSGATATKQSMTRDQIVDTLASLSAELPRLGRELRQGGVDLGARGLSAFAALSSRQLDGLRSHSVQIAAAPFVDAMHALELQVRTSADDAAAARSKLASIRVPQATPIDMVWLVAGGALLIASFVLATFMLVAVRRHRELQKVAHTDALTGAANRRRLDRDTATASTTNIGVLMIDLDHFKKLNDAAGHRAGDDALRRVAQVIAACLRGSDVLYRYGGEEFCALLPGASVAESELVAARICAAVEAISVPGEEHLPGGRQTVSIGVATGLDARTCIGEADRALYEAKHGGRNRFATAG